MKIFAALMMLVASVSGQEFKLTNPDPFPIETITADSVLYTFFNPTTEKAYLQYSPADPDKRVIVDGSFNMSTLVYTTEGKKVEFWGLTSSYETGQIFVNNFRKPALMEYNVNTDKLKTIFNDMTGGVENLAFDRVTKTLYWADSINKLIMAVEKSYRHFTPIWESTTVSPYALVLHVTKRKLVFSVHLLADGFISGSRMMTCDLDGGNMDTLFKFPDVIRVLGITIDYSEDRLYWTDMDTRQNSIVQASNFDGTGRRQFFSQSTGLLWGIAHYKDLFYVADLVNVSKTNWQIHIRYKDGITGRKIYKSMRPRNVNIYGPNEVSKTKVTNECNFNDCDQICLASSAGERTCRCSPGYKIQSDGTCLSDVLDDNYLIFADIGQKRLFQMKVTEFASQALEFNAMPFDDKTDEKIYSMTVDSSTGEIAWYDLDNKKIHWGDDSFVFSTDAVTSMTTSPFTQTLIWTTSTRIYTKTKTGLWKMIYNLPFFTSKEIRQITYDVGGKYIYWTEYDTLFQTSEVWRMKKDGKDQELVLADLPIIKAIKIDYQNYKLYVMSMTKGLLYSIPLKLMETTIPSTSPNYSQYDVIDFGIYIKTKAFLVFDFAVANGFVYLLDSLSPQIRRFNIKMGPSSMENYGPSDFYFMTTISYYSRAYFRRYIEPLRPGYLRPTTSTTTTTTTTTTRPTTSTEPYFPISNPVNCDDLLNGPVNKDVIKQYINCILGGVLG